MNDVRFNLDANNPLTKISLAPILSLSFSDVSLCDMR
jgi:hypothetical protein